MPNMILKTPPAATLLYAYLMCLLYDREVAALYGTKIIWKNKYNKASLEYNIANTITLHATL